MTFKTSLASLALLLVACGAGSGSEGDETDEAAATRVVPQAATLDLYPSPGAVPDPRCDVHTRLELGAKNGTHAHLEEASEGGCTTATRPDPRNYRLRLDHAACGSRVYTGAANDGVHARTIVITDHRARVCKDSAPAKIVVEETVDGRTRTMFSLDAPPSFCARALCGPETECDERERRCVPVAPFCLKALCGPETHCSDTERRCVPN